LVIAHTGAEPAALGGAKPAPSAKAAAHSGNALILRTCPLAPVPAA